MRPTEQCARRISRRAREAFCRSTEAPDSELGRRADRDHEGRLHRRVNVALNVYVPARKVTVQIGCSISPTGSSCRCPARSNGSRARSRGRALESCTSREECVSSGGRPHRRSRSVGPALVKMRSGTQGEPAAELDSEGGGGGGGGGGPAGHFSGGGMAAAAAASGRRMRHDPHSQLTGIRVREELVVVVLLERRLEGHVPEEAPLDSSFPSGSRAARLPTTGRGDGSCVSTNGRRSARDRSQR